MTVYNENNVPILYLGPDQKLGLSEEGYAELKSARDAAHDALYAASEAVRATGRKLQDALGVPVGSGETAQADYDAAVEAASAAYHDALEAQGAAEAEHLLAGHSVVIHNKAPRGGTDQESKTLVGIGASDVDEAIKEAISAFDLAHLGTPDQTSDTEYPPDWVASSHPLLGKLLGDYYNCDVRNLSEVL